MQANEIINQLQNDFINDRFQFDFKVSMYISGDSKKQLRKEIMYLLTGETRPVSKCGMYAVSDAMRYKFQQATLF